MTRAAVFALFVALIPGVAAAQIVSTLRVRVVLVNAARTATPVPHHALLISDNPATAAPRRILTAMDGTADVKLRPGNYTVESERPVAFEGKAYQWAQTLDIVLGRDAVLELTADNAEVEPLTSGAGGSATALNADTSAALSQWQDGVFALWSPTTHGSGFLIDAKGLVATSERVVGKTASVEVQISPSTKVPASVLVADAARDVAILWVDPQVAAPARALPLSCGEKATGDVARDQEVFAIAAPLRQEKGLTSATVSRVNSKAIESDLILASGSAGGPVFTASGEIVGLTSISYDEYERRRGETRIVRIGALCDLLATAERKMAGTPPPGDTRLPIEPSNPFPLDVLKEAAQHRAGSLKPYQVSSADFDIALMTPIQVYAAQNPPAIATGRGRSGGTRAPEPDQTLLRPLMDFSNWSEYVAELPPVLLVRVTPKLVEGFWTKVARGAASTQGVSLPPIKHFKSGFLRLRAFCGTEEVTPVHPFRLEQRVSETEAIYEGLYVFDPGALAPSCGTVKFSLYSEKEPDKADTREIDPKVIDQIWQDFAPLRSPRR